MGNVLSLQHRCSINSKKQIGWKLSERARTMFTSIWRVVATCWKIQRVVL